MVPVPEADIVAHQGVVDHLGDMLADFDFGVNHAVDTQFRQDAVVRFCLGLGPDRLDAKQFQVDGRQDARFKITAHGNQRHRTVAQPGLAQGGIIAGVHDNGLAQLFDMVADALVVQVHADHVVAKTLQLGCDRRAKIAKADHADSPSFHCHHEGPLKGSVLPRDTSRHRGKQASAVRSFRRSAAGTHVSAYQARRAANPPRRANRGR